MQSMPLGSSSEKTKQLNAFRNSSPQGPCAIPPRHGQSQLISPVSGLKAPSGASPSPSCCSSWAVADVAFASSSAAVIVDGAAGWLSSCLDWEAFSCCCCCCFALVDMESRVGREESSSSSYLGCWRATMSCISCQNIASLHIHIYHAAEELRKQARVTKHTGRLLRKDGTGIIIVDSPSRQTPS